MLHRKRFIGIPLAVAVVIALYTYSQPTRVYSVPALLPDAAFILAQGEPPLTPGTPGGTNAAVPSGQVQIEFSGTVENVGATSFVINGLLIEGVADGPIEAGMTVHVVALPMTGGRLMAQEIQRLPHALPPGIVRITGILSAYNGDFVVLTGAGDLHQVIDINSTTLDFSRAQIGQPLTLFVTAVGVNQWRGLAVDITGASAFSGASPYLLGPVARAGLNMTAPILPSLNAVPTPGMPTPPLTTGTAGAPAAGG